MTRDKIDTYDEPVDLVFKALNDVHRRRILDLLHERDGLTSSEIEAHFHDITRFGVMKHLGVLEEALLISTRKEGRFKYHYLNSVPLQEIADRWIARFKAPWTKAVVDLKSKLEKEADTMSKAPKHVYVTVIKTTPEKLWQALTDPQFTPAYYYGSTLSTDLQAGSDFQYLTPDGHVMVGGKVIEALPYSKLVTTFTGNWMPEMHADAPSRVTYEILQQGDCCRLTLIHDEFVTETKTFHVVEGGWPGILSGLKTLLETGQPLNYRPMGS